MWSERQPKLAWPRKLKQALLDHLKHVQSDLTMPSLQMQPPFNVQDVLNNAAKEVAKKDVPSERVQVIVAFLLDLFEQSCVSSLLNENERRTFHELIPQPGNVATTTPVVRRGAVAVSKKRQRIEEPSLVSVEDRLYYSTNLPVEYLLRLLASLPLLISHYHILCGSTRLNRPSYKVEDEGDQDKSNPSTDHEDLWIVARAILAHVNERSSEYLTPDSRYAQLILLQE